MSAGRCLAFAFATAGLCAQSFDVASVKLSAKPVGKDYNNQIAIGSSTFSGRNITLKRLIVEAYGVDPPQVFGGPKWLDEAEYDVEAKADRPAGKEELRRMLQAVLAARFHLATHRETREFKVFEMVVDKGGPKIQPVKEGEGAPVGAAGGAAAPLGSGHFHGDLKQLANLISVQLTIPTTDDSDPARPAIASGPPVPVFNMTGLSGTYDFDVDMRREPGSAAFNRWQRVLREQLGLKLESRRQQVDGIVVDGADRVPVAN